MKKILIPFSLTGLLVPFVILIIASLQGGVFGWPTLGIILWPTWVVAAGADAYATPTAFIVNAFLAIAVTLNVLLYAAIGAIVWRFIKR